MSLFSSLAVPSSQSFYRQLRKIQKWFSKKEWCVGLILTGSQTFFNGVGDYDFLVITQDNCLWKAREETLFWAFLQGQKRWPGQKKDCGWCFNLWLEESFLTIPKSRQSLFSAGELWQGKWLIDKNNLRQKIWQENSWANKKIATFLGSDWQKTWQKNNFFNYLPVISTSLPDQPPFNESKNSRAWRRRQFYKHSYIGHEFISLHQAFFHPISRSDDAWKAKLLSVSAHYNHQTVVLVTGVFDLFHSAHQSFLQNARQTGDILLVGLESDARVTTLKGLDRPIWPATRRASVIDHSHLADAVFILPENFGLSLIRQKWLHWLQPDILAVSAHTPHLKSKRLELKSFPTQLIIVSPHNPHISTTQILNSASYPVSK